MNFKELIELSNDENFRFINDEKIKGIYKYRLPSNKYSQKQGTIGVEDIHYMMESFSNGKEIEGLKGINWRIPTSDEVINFKENFKELPRLKDEGLLVWCNYRRQNPQLSKCDSYFIDFDSLIHYEDNTIPYRTTYLFLLLEDD